jgi:flavin-dependent dehydrogenase
MRLFSLVTTVCLTFVATLAPAADVTVDVAVYGGTSGGVVAALQAARMGKRVVLIEPGRHLGGMTSGGLSAVDIGDPRTVGGITREFFTRLVARYGKKLAWDEPHKAVGGSGGGTGGAYAIEPHVAEEVFEELVKEAGVPVLRDARLIEVTKEGPRISRIVVAGPDGKRSEIAAKMFIDTTYEGDLMAAAGVSHTLTREGRDKYDESLAGIRYADWCRPRAPHEQPGPNGRKPSGQGVWDRDFPLDPYVRKGDPSSGLLPLINPGEPGTPGAAAPGVQAYCFRLCLTTAADRLPIEPPPGYDPARYEIVVRFIEACLANGDDMDLRWFSKHDPVPNDKYDFNTATFGGNLPGASWGWCEASPERRQELFREHEHHQRGLLHFLATDPRVPAKVRADMRRFGLPRDEFRDTGGWPHQLYVREGRRMIGELVMTQHHVCGKRVADDPVSLGSYGIDAHEIRRIVKDGVVTREGKLAEGRGTGEPYGISYRSIVPKQAECDNLLVTFALSASHVAFSSIRMEPVFMVSSQTAATAAAMAIDEGVPVQAVDYAKLKPRLVADGQILSMPAPPPKAPKNAAKPEDVNGNSYDLVVIGGTPGGIACAVRAAREGLRVLLVNHTRHLGGFITSGAGGWEATYDGHRSPLYGEMLAGAAAYYRDRYGDDSPQHVLSMPSKTSRAHIDRAKVEPRVAELLFNGIVEREQSLAVLLGHVVSTANREGAVLKSVTLQPLHGQGTITVSGKVFADAMYEGDLMAAAGVKTQVGRESREKYGEKHAGVIYTKERDKEPGQRGFPKAADEGTLNIRTIGHATGEIIAGPHSGEADDSVMAYNYRLILTRDPVNRIMVEKPANYDPAIAKAAAGGGFVPNLPNGKVAWNGGRLIGPQIGYPAADWPAREAIAKRYLDAMLMRLWWLQNDPEAPAGEREAFAGYGLAADEFRDNHNVPYEIYVREARRLVGRYVFKEQDNLVADGIARTPIHTDSIAMTDWPMDSVACLPRRAGESNLDGIFFIAEESRPAQVPYRSILTNEIDNLLVPVAISASHVGWGSIRLEPVWMQLGESAGHAAALAVKGGTTPAKLDPDHLVRKLSASCVMVTFFNDVDVASNEPRVAAAQYFGTKGFFAGYDARLEEPLKASTQSVWERGLSALREGTLDPADLARQVHRAEGQDSPPTDRTRGAVLDSMWRALPGSPLAMTPVRSSRAAEVDGKQYDLVVIGGTPGGIACAVRAAREGLTALLVQHNGHLGGMLTNGLMQWDALYGGPRSPIFDEYARMIEDHYRETYGDHSPQFAAARYTQTHYPMSRFEPSVAERLFNRLVSAESRITTLLFHHPAAVTREGPLVKTLTLRAYGTTNDITVGGGTFVDATYEGDLAVVAKVPYRVGRESRAEFAEPHAGKVFTNIVSKQGPKEALEGRLNLHPYAHAQGGIDPTSPHTADDAIQAYNHRFCVSNEPGKIRLPEKPPGYDREAYVNYNRKGLDAGAINGKSSWNSAILPGENHAYPEATWPEREKIIARHTRFALGQDLHLPGVQDGAGAAGPHLPGVQDGAGAAGSHLQLQGLPDGARGAGSHLHLPGLPHGGRAAGEDLHLEGLQDGPRGVLPRGVLQGLHDGQGDPHQAGAGLHDPPGPLHQDGGRGADGAEAGRLHGDPLRAEDRVPRGALLRVIAGLPMLLARPHAGR